MKLTKSQCDRLNILRHNEGKDDAFFPDRDFDLERNGLLSIFCITNLPELTFGNFETLNELFVFILIKERIGVFLFEEISNSSNHKSEEFRSHLISISKHISLDDIYSRFQYLFFDEVFNKYQHDNIINFISEQISSLVESRKYPAASAASASTSVSAARAPAAASATSASATVSAARAPAAASATSASATVSAARAPAAASATSASATVSAARAPAAASAVSASAAVSAASASITVSATREPATAYAEIYHGSEEDPHTRVMYPDLIVLESIKANRDVSEVSAGRYSLFNTPKDQKIGVMVLDICKKLNSFVNNFENISQCMALVHEDVNEVVNSIQILDEQCELLSLEQLGEIKEAFDRVVIWTKSNTDQAMEEHIDTILRLSTYFTELYEDKIQKEFNQNN